jgi:branched-chain amino acid transport system substrate-binding protein
MKLRIGASLVAVTAVAAFSLVVSVGASSSAPSEIVIGTSLPLTGSLASFGPQIQDGYQHAIDAVNAAGGLTVGGQKHKVKLIIVDNASNPVTATQQIKTLVQQDGAVALLGSATPPLNIPISDAADSLKIPLVTSITPVQAWLGGTTTGWKYSWDLFFNENQMTSLQFETSNLVTTNKKIALFTDTEQDGITMGALWTKRAPTFGYTIAYHASFPVGTTDFSSFISDAQAAGAQILIAQMLPPDGITLWKQIAASSWHPTLAYCEKCADVQAWQQALGKTAEGTLASDWWTPSLNRAGTATFVKEYEGKFGNNADLANLVSADSAAQVLLDAIKRAGSTNPQKLNTAISKTNGNYPIAHVKFGSNHASSVTAFMTQWQGSAMKLVYPKGKGAAKLETPTPGL